MYAFLQKILYFNPNLIMKILQPGGTLNLNIKNELN